MTFLEGEYILHSFERTGRSTAVFMPERLLHQHALYECRAEPWTSARQWALSHELRAKGYGLLCVARAVGPLEAETQDEDEVYETAVRSPFRQSAFRHQLGLPLDEE